MHVHTYIDKEYVRTYVCTNREYVRMLLTKVRSYIILMLSLLDYSLQVTFFFLYVCTYMQTHV